jgi:hypothetical protein
MSLRETGSEDVVLSGDERRDVGGGEEARGSIS